MRAGHHHTRHKSWMEGSDRDRAARSQPAKLVVSRSRIAGTRCRCINRSKSSLRHVGSPLTTIHVAGRPPPVPSRFVVGARSPPSNFDTGFTAATSPHSCFGSHVSSLAGMHVIVRFAWACQNATSPTGPVMGTRRAGTLSFVRVQSSGAVRSIM